MSLARPVQHGWCVSTEPVGDIRTLIGRLIDEAGNGAVALGIDCPIGLPRAFVARHLDSAVSFPAFLRSLAHDAAFFQVSETLDEVGPTRPFYPRRGIRGMTRQSHARALGLAGAAELSRVCDRATAQRPSGAPVFWTLGANQSGKAAISVWRDFLLPAFADTAPPALWPFDGPFLSLLRPGRMAIAETYPAEASRQLGLRLVGSKRRQADRLALIPDLARVMAELRASPDTRLDTLLKVGFGSDRAGEDRFDSLLGVLCVLLVIEGRRPDTAPADPWITQWEGWVLGQSPHRS